MVSALVSSSFSNQHYLNKTYFVICMFAPNVYGHVYMHAVL